MNRTLRSLALPAAAALLLAGCGGTDETSEPSATGAPAAEAPAAPSDGGTDGSDEGKSSGEIQAEHMEEVTGEGGAPELFSLTEEPFFVSTSTGALITMTMDAQPEADEEIAWLEQYREDAGGDPVTYILSEVDNRDGSEPVNMYATTLYSEDGQSFECEMSADYADENWEPVWLYLGSDTDEYTTADGEPMDYEKGEELSDRLNEHEVDDTVDPFESGTIVSICPADLPDEVAAVEVMPGGVYIDPVYATPESYMGEDG